MIRTLGVLHPPPIPPQVSALTINAVQSVPMNEYERLVLKWNNGSVDEYP
jgi:hypothetical protein